MLASTLGVASPTTTHPEPETKMALSSDKRGLYGQDESDAGLRNAAVERVKDAEAEGHIVGSENDYVRKMAEFRLSQNKHATAERKMRKGSMLGIVVARTGQRSALQGVAGLVYEMKEAGFSHNVAIGAINRSEGLAAHIERTENSRQIAPTTPNYNGKARLRSATPTINSAARNGTLDKYRDAKKPVNARMPIIPVEQRDCGKDDHDGETSKRYIV